MSGSSASATTSCTLHAEQTFGREHMARFTGAQLMLG